ncbi:c-type cytochrome [Chitinophaga eiseniae]|nr:c-type cytochrome [Chitinophaga eiseniae]
MKKRSVVTFLLAGASLLIYHCSIPRHAAFAPTTATEKLPRDSSGKIIVQSNPDGAYLSTEQSLAAIHVPDGYHLQLVASEPMVKEPVAIAWDGNGRMFVSEMLTYMQDVDGSNENAPLSRISLLEDTNGDGVMDKSTIYIDSLVLPRMILCVGKKLLVSETYTNNIWSYEDVNQDGKADKKVQVFGNSTPHSGNLEHQRSGLIWNIDNRIYVTYENLRYRYSNDKLVADTMFTGYGQWGIGNDDYGRLYFSAAGGEVPAYGFQLNPFYGRYDVPEQLADGFNAVWPVIATPDVQGGPGRLRPDSTLNHFTGCCGQSIFRGNALPDDLKGDLLICEPVGRLIRRAKVTNQQGIRVLQNAYQQEEFIAATDMNFRPVNTANGPDGCLYIVDMHRGIIQEGNWTRKGSYLRPEILKRGLDKNISHGRIYRLIHDGYRPGPKPNLLAQDGNTLVSYLSHANGWWRDNAQKELIVRQDLSVLPALVSMLEKHTNELARLHALWTLEGLHAVNSSILATAMKDASPQVRKAAVIISEPFLKLHDAGVKDLLTGQGSESDADVQAQLVATLAYYAPGESKKIQEHFAQSGGNTKNLVAIASLIEKNRNQKMYGFDLAGIPANEKAVILKGQETFQQVCATCHGDNGKGISIGGAPMAAPPLANSPRTGNPNMLINILLHGLSGPIDGKTYPDVMAPLGAANSDEWVSNVLSYVHYRFRPSRTDFTVITPEEVKKIRTLTENRSALFTISELENFQPTEKSATVVATSTTVAKKETATPKRTVTPSAFATEKQLLAKLDCAACHRPDVKLVGPSYKAIAQKYKRSDINVNKLAGKVIAGGSGNWGTTPMIPHPALSTADARKIVRYILSL